MDREISKGPLKGFSGPTFPRISNRLNNTRQVITLSEDILEETARTLKSHGLFKFAKMEKMSTEDAPGHLLIFETDLGEIAVLFPKNQQRSVAIYGKGENKHGPQSIGEFEAQIRFVLEALHEGLLNLTKISDS